MVAWFDTALRVQRINGDGAAVWPTAALGATGAIQGNARLSTNGSGHVLIAASLVANEKTVRVALLSAGGLVLANVIVKAKYPVTVLGAALASVGTVLSGQATYAPGFKIPWAMLVNESGKVLLEQVSPTGSKWSSVIATQTGLVMANQLSVSGVGVLGLMGTDGAGNPIWNTQHNADLAAMSLPTARALDRWADGSLALLGAVQTTAGPQIRVIRTDPWGHDSCDAAGTCASKPVIGCADTNLCTFDACDGKGGCTHKPAPDGSLCAIGKVCAGGTCVGP